MKLRSILFGQSLRFSQGFRQDGNVYLPGLVQQLAQRYNFLITPDIIQFTQAEQKTGLEFKHGLFTSSALSGGQPREIVVDSFGIYNDGFLANSLASVEDADAFIDDAVEWISRTYRIEFFNGAKARSHFSSQLEVELDPEFLDRFSFLEGISLQIDKLLSQYGVKASSYATSNFSLHFGGPSQTPPALPAFQVEHRAGYEFSDNVFFSAAPLKTRDHLELLQMVEAL